MERSLEIPLEVRTDRREAHLHGKSPARWTTLFVSGLCPDCVLLRSRRRSHCHSGPRCSLEWRPQLWKSVQHKKKQMPERQHLRMAILKILVFPLKTCPPPIKEREWISPTPLCRAGANQIRRGWGGEKSVLAAGGGAQEQQPPKEDKRQDVSDTVRISTAATWVSPKPAPAIKTRITRLYSMSCLSALCDPRSQTSPRHGRKGKPGEAETHRIEEGVAALYPLMPSADSACEKPTWPTQY